jgi:hypothetical protein
MMAVEETADTLFLGTTPWPTITATLRAARSCEAVTPFLTSAAMLPLERGDRLVVDASLVNVRAGLTDPRAIEALRRRGVRCYTVTGLHAKVYIADDTVFVGSSNATINSRESLIEACAQISDARYAARALVWIDALPLRPLRKADLAALIPEFTPQKRRATPRTPAATSWVTWIRRDGDSQALAEYQKEVAERHVLAEDDLYPILFRTRTPPRLLREGQPGDEVFVIDRRDRNRVYGPMRLLEVPTATTVDGRRHYYLALESCDASIALSAFRRAAARGETPISASGRSTRRLNPAAAAFVRRCFIGGDARAPSGRS